MSSKSFIAFISIFLIGIIEISAQVVVTLEPYGKKKDLSEITIPNKIYAVKVAPFDAQDITRRIKSLSNQMSFDEEVIENGMVKYLNRKQRSVFIYDKERNHCIYNNRRVGPLKDGTYEDAEKYRKNAEQYLAAILGEKSRSYIFINNSFDEAIKRNTPELKQVAYINYRFVPVMDSVPVLGITAQANVTIGENGELFKFRSNEPLLVEYGTVKTKVHKNAIRKVLDKKVNAADYFPPTQDGVKLKAEKVDVKQWTGSYFEITKAGKKLLYPHISLFAVNQLAKNKHNLNSIKSLINLSMSGSDWPDLNANDIEKIKYKEK